MAGYLNNVNAASFSSGRWTTGCILALLALLLVGCETPRIDWQARIGAYTYDQAVLDYGPPDKVAKLADGTTVAEWMTRPGYSYSYPAGYPWPPWYCGPYYPVYEQSYSPPYFLRLTFGPDGKLRAWKKFAK